MKLALFKCLSRDITDVCMSDASGNFWCDPHKDYVRLSEAVHVDFVMLENNESVVQAAALEQAKQAAKQANDLVDSLEDK